MDAIDSLDLDAPWADVRESIRLVLPRRRPLPEHTGARPQRVVGPSIPASLGMDIGPAMLFVTNDRLGDWDVTADEAFDQALTNVRSRVEARGHFALIHEDLEGTPALAFQSREGWASALVALPELLGRVLGTSDGIILAPMRDLVLRLPPDADPELATWILGEFAAADMNALDVPPLALVDGALTEMRAPIMAAPQGRSMH